MTARRKALVALAGVLAILVVLVLQITTAGPKAPAVSAGGGESAWFTPANY